MATLAELAGYKSYAVRSDGAKWVDGVRNDAADTSWLTYQSGILTLGPGTYDELMFQRRVASEQEIIAWHKAGAFHDPSQRIGGTVIEDDSIETRHIKAESITAESGIIKSMDIGKATTGLLRVTPKAGQGASGIVIDDGTEDRIAQGDVGGRAWGPGQLAPETYGFWGEQVGLYFRGYARLLRTGYEEDEGEIDLRDEPNLANPVILLAPKQMLTYSPQQPNAVPNIFTDYVEMEPGLYKVKAKTIVKGAFTALSGTGGNVVDGTWTRPTSAGPGGDKGVQTNFFQCRLSWFASGGFWITLRQYVTNQFDSNGDPINWQQVRSFSEQGPLFGSKNGSLNWDISLPNDVWAIRVDVDGHQTGVGIIYAQASVDSAGYRSDVYLDNNGNSIGPEDPSGMSVLYFAVDQG